MIDWTCSSCKYWNDGRCKLLGGSSYQYGFCDGYVKQQEYKQLATEICNLVFESDHLNLPTDEIVDLVEQRLKDKIGG